MLVSRKHLEWSAHSALQAMRLSRWYIYTKDVLDNMVVFYLL